MEIQQGIYQIRNLLNNKKYIGSSIDLYDRKNNHFKELKKNNHHNVHLQNSYNEYGEDNFLFEIIEINNSLSRIELYELEQIYINSFNWDYLYNISRDVKSGGFEALCVPVFLLNLDGEIEKEFDSIQDCSRFLNKTQINSDRLNRDTLINRTYRIVTQDFYNDNLDIILSWENKIKNQLLKEEAEEDYRRLYKIIYLDVDNKTYRFETLEEASNFIDISKERIRQLCNSDWTINQKYKFYRLVDRDIKYENQNKLTLESKNKPLKCKFEKYYKFDEELEKWIVFTEDEIIAQLDDKKTAILMSRCLDKVLKEK